MTHITSCRNVTSIEHTANTVFATFWLVLPFREGIILNGLVKTDNCVVVTSFQHTKLSPFENISLVVILKKFLLFPKFALDVLKKHILIRNSTILEIHALGYTY